MLYLANPSTEAIRDAMAAYEIGAIVTPRQGNKLPAEGLYIVDNGCGPDKDGVAGRYYPGDAEYLAFLRGLAERDGHDFYDPDTDRCLFAVAPDVLGDAAATIKRSQYFLPLIREIACLRAALVAQNGLVDEPGRGWGAYDTDGSWLALEWDDFQVLFLGGDTAWKLGPVARALTAEAQRRGKRVHMGRVNSLNRFQYAEAIGCDTCDGTFLAFAPDKNLPKVRGWDRAVNSQGALFDMIGAA